jgi:hypothetical protein
MSRFTEEYIFNYLDQALTPEENAELELEMQNDPELKITVEQFRTAHIYFLENQIEATPEKLSDQIMAEVSTLSSQYYRPSGLFNNTNFLLIAGILTAVIAFLSMVNAGYFDLQTLAPSLTETDMITEWTFLDGMISKRIITNSMMVIYGVLALGLLDRFILNPLFRRKVKLGFN